MKLLDQIINYVDSGPGSLDTALREIQELALKFKDELQPALNEARGALNGDSNDAEHDALFSLVEVLDPDFKAADDGDEYVIIRRASDGYFLKDASVDLSVAFHPDRGFAVPFDLEAGRDLVKAHPELYLVSP